MFAVMQAGATFTQQDGGFDLWIDGRLIMRHRPDALGMILARGNPHIEMVRGNFAIDDNPVPMPALTFAEISANQVRLSVNAGAPPAAILTLRGEAGAYTLEIEATGLDYDRLTVSFVAQPDEHICGGGEQMSYLNLRGRAFPIWTSEPGVGRDKARELTHIMDAEGMAGGEAGRGRRDRVAALCLPFGQQRV